LGLRVVVVVFLKMKQKKKKYLLFVSFFKFVF